MRGRVEGKNMLSIDGETMLCDGEGGESSSIVIATLAEVKMQKLRL